MSLTIGSVSALHALRAVRCGDLACDLAKRCNMIAPSPHPQRRWSKGQLSAQLSSVGLSELLARNRRVNVIVPTRDQRVQSRGVENSVYSCPLPENSFIVLGNGIAMSCPELLFIELGNVMEPAIHLLAGMELCGCFSRSAQNPRTGDAVYGIEPVTSVSRIREYAERAKSVRGSSRAIEAIELIEGQAWSPMEALIAALAILPMDKLGLDLGRVRLNPRKELGERLSRLSSAASRVPDIMFMGTNVGINYDGEDHFRLDGIARAAVALDRDPGNADRAQELADAFAEARGRIVSDKRRDRDLMSLGLTVFPVAKEDLLEPGGFDRVMGQVVAAIERSEHRDLTAQRMALADGRLADARYALMRSLMPGGSSKGVAASMSDLHMGFDDAMVSFEMDDDGRMTISTIRD